MTDDVAMRSPPMRWRAEKRTTMAAAESYGLWQGGELLAVVQVTGGGFFWYAMHRDVKTKNTANEPTDLDTAKRDAAAWCRTQRRTP